MFTSCDITFGLGLVTWCK